MEILKKKRKRKIIAFILIIWIIVLFFMLKDYYTEKNYNGYRCETKKYEIIGVISWVNKKTNYSQIRIKKSSKTYSFDIDRIKYQKAFPNWVTYKVGDSVIKFAGSKEVKIKRGDNYAIYIIDCDD